MTDDNDFFGDVFDDPEDDPLLGEEDSSSSGAAPGEPEHQGPPSWMADEPQSNGQAVEEEETAPKQKQIIVDQRGKKSEGIGALNQAVGEGWRLVRICLAQPDGQQAGRSDAARRFVAILEQDRPQSLFDFGAPS